MAKKKSISGSTMSSAYDKYKEAFNSVKASIDELRLNQCIECNCEDSDLPDIERLLVIGKDNDGVYWMFDSDAFYWSSTVELPTMYQDGHMYINPTYDDIISLVHKKLLHQYVVIAPM